MDQSLKYKHETIRVLEENVGKELLSIDLGNDSLDMTPKAQTSKQ